MGSDAATVEDYLAELPEDRREAVTAVREAVLENLPEGYEETVNWGMITWQVPLERYPDTYNGQPLMAAALASQKRHMALYLNTVYTSPEREAGFRERWESTGRKLDMGKSCVRFRKLEDVPLEVVGEAIASAPVGDFIAAYERSRG